MNVLRQYVLVIMLPLIGVSLSAAPMSGVYTCAKGNPGGVFDYADIGDFFDDLEDNGVNGPTTLDVYDDGGPFTSNDSYLLGADVTSSTSGWLITGDLVAGVNTLRPLTIRAAKGEVPVIYGAGAPGIVVGQGQPPLANAWGGLSFFDTSNVTLEGLVIVGGGGFGILFYCHNAPQCDSIRVRKCTISDVSWSAICFHGKHTSMNDVVIENNMCWGSLDGDGVIDGGPPSGQNWVVRNNTILTRDGSVVTSAFSSGSTQPWDVLEGNVAVVASSGAPRYFLLGGATTIDHNVVSLSGVGQMGTAYPTWTDWQAAGFDINGVNADPMFENATQWQEDLRLRPGSPAIDLIPFSSLADDVFGNPRPSGLAIDAGAHELQVPNQPAQALEPV